MNLPPNYASMSQWERARWYADEAARLAKESREFADKATRYGWVAAGLGALGIVLSLLAMAMVIWR